MTSIDLTDLNATRAFAIDFARTLRPGDVVALEGDLGAGKTTLVREIIDALGGDPSQVSSPTFVIVHEYETPLCGVFHIDAYRIDAISLESIGFAELLEQRAIILIEWPSRVREALPTKLIELAIEVVGETARRVVVRR